MKPKDLNTFINHKLNQGSGLRYEDEYWNDMNSLLDANMPVAKAENTATENATQSATQTATQTATIGAKVSYLLSACAATVGGIFMYVQLFNTPATAPTENTPSSNNTPTTAQTITPDPTRLPQYTSPEYTSPTSENTNTDTEQPQHSEHPIENNEVPQPTGKITTDVSGPISSQNITSQENTFSPDTKSETSDMRTATPGSKETASNGVFVAGSTDQHVSTHSTEFFLIEPMNNSGKTTKITSTQESTVLPPSSQKRNRLFQHIDVSPFIGMIAETGDQTYQSGNILYTHPAQSHLTYGVNIECATKQFSIRTGIGLSNTSLQSTITSETDLYDVDTNYVIIKSNYGTTLSGKPVALVQRQLDSSYVSTQYTTIQENTTYQYITIPLTLQYKMAVKRFSFMVEGGGLHHIMVSQQTNSLQQTESENRIVLPVYSFQLTAGSSIRYALTAQWAVGVQYNYNLNHSSANLHFLNNAHVGVLMITYSIH